MSRERRLTRRERMAQEKAIPLPKIAPKPVPRLIPKNHRQAQAIEYLEEGRQVVFLTGSAGTGKSLIAAYHASKQYQAKQVRKIYLVRPAVSVGKSIGLLPGEIKEKLAPYFAQTVAHISKFLDQGVMAYALEKEHIEMKPVEYLRGMSFEDCIVIAEEVQNFTPEEMEMMLTRIGDNCTVIFTGDTKQHDLKGVSGLDSAIALIERMLRTHPEYMDGDDIDMLDDNIGVVKFQPTDVVRSGFTRALVKMYYHNS